MIYTYTERRDMIGYECFVGVLTAKGDIYLLEAGQNCERGHEPMKYGMRLTQVAKCYNHGEHEGPQGIHPKFSHHWPHSGHKRPLSDGTKRATALPTWREKVLNEKAGSSSASRKTSALWWSPSVTVLLLLISWVR